jgi:DNA-directed RNA polymerase specialized sigma24 family protein
MSVASLIGSHIPHLRRFARALTGSQTGGDAYVQQLLEALIEDPSLLAKAKDPRVSLYKTFLQILSSVAASGWQTAPKPWATGFDRNVAAMTPRTRQAFLLRHVEGFTLPETAEILGATVDETQALLEKAGEEIARQVATDALIIEDEPLIVMDLTQILEELGHRVVAVARTRDEARRAMAKPRLADGSSGLDAVNDLLQSFEVPVIFITAYPEKLLTGEKPEPTFLITKPYQPETLHVTISQALFFDQRSRRAA